MDFSTPNGKHFDPVVWINSNLAADASAVDVDELVIKLQAKGADFVETLQQSSQQLFQLLPQITKEAEFIHQEAVLMRGVLQEIVADVDDIVVQNQKSVQFLAEIDQVKGRVEHASKTLSEVDNWKSRVSQIEKLINTQELPRIADEVHKLSVSLEAFTSLPEFPGRQKELEEYQARVEAMATPQLVELIRSRDAVGLASMVQIFSKIGRLGTLKQMYFDAITDTLSQLGGKNERNSLPDWLPEFFLNLTQLSHQELHLLPRIFPQDNTVANELQVAIFAQVEKNLGVWVREFVDSRGTAKVIGAYDIYTICLDALLRESFEETQASSAEMLECFMAPFLPYQKNYGALEQEYLVSLLDTVAFGGDDYEHTARNFRESSDLVLASLRDSVPRCLQLTGGIHSADLISAMNSCMSEYINRLFTLLRKLRAAAGFDSDAAVDSGSNNSGNNSSSSGSNNNTTSSSCLSCPSSSSSSSSSSCVSSSPSLPSVTVPPVREEKGFFDDSDEEKEQDILEADWSGFQGAFQLLHICQNLQSNLRELDTQIIRVLSEAISAFVLEQEDRSFSVQHYVHARLVQSPDAKQELRAFYDKIITPGCGLLTVSLELLEGFSKVLETLIYDTMFQPIRDQLKLMRSWKLIWEAQTKVSLIRLPSFSLQPSDYILKLGEHLLSLVAQLTPFAAKPTDDENAGTEGQVNTDTLYWLSMVGQGVANELVKRIQGIPHLSEQGGKQLACDIEYLANVIGALGLTMKPVLLGIATVAKAESADEVMRLVSEGMLNWESGRDRNTIQLVLDIREISYQLPAGPVETD